MVPPARSSVIRNALAASREAAALLAILSVGKRAGADAKVFSARVHQGAAARGAVGVTGAPAGDELLALAVADVGGSRGVLLQGTGLDGTATSVVLVPAIVVVLGAAGVAASASVVVIVAALVPGAGVVVVATLIGGAARLEAAALLASLSLGTDARADADGGAALGKGRAALGGAVGNAEALSADELNAFAVSDVLLAGGVGEVLTAGKIRGGLNGGEGHCQVIRNGQGTRRGLTHKPRY